MATRGPFSGRSLQSAQPPAEESTTAERLAEVERLLQANEPWPAFLHIGTETVDGWENCPEVAQEALRWMATSAGGLLDITSVGPLTPVCQAFKSLIEAAAGAAEAHEKLRELVHWCARLTHVFIKLGKTVGALSGVSSSLQEFVSTTNRLAKRMKPLANRHKFTALILYGKDTKEIARFEAKLRSIWADVRGLAVSDVRERPEELRPPKLEPMAAIPPGALALPDSYVERTSLIEEAVRVLTAPDAAASRTPHLLLGVGGGGKTVLASSIVRHEAVRKHFRHGVFWIRVGPGGKDQLNALFQGLSREVGAAPVDTPQRVPYGSNSLDETVQHLSVFARSSNAPRLVVLDDVWEREVVDTLLPTGLALLVTARDRSVVVRGGCIEVGDMTVDEAMVLLGHASRNVGSPGVNLRAGMQQVARDCGFCPLALAIAGSMPVVEGHGPSTQAWKELHEHLMNKEEILRKKVGAVKSISHVLDASFDSLGRKRQNNMMSMAVLPKGAAAPMGMLLNLWEIGDLQDCCDVARGLVGRSLLQAVGSNGYRVHDLVLDFVKDRVKPAALEKAASRQAQYLGRLDVVRRHSYAGDSSKNDFYSLMALWRPIEELSTNPRLQVEAYSTNLELVRGEESKEVAYIYGVVGSLLGLQGKFEEADLLFQQALMIREKIYGEDHQRVAATLSNRANMLSHQGKHDEADLLYQRALAISEKVYGKDHPEVAVNLSNRAELLQGQGKYTEADVLYQQTLAIEEEVHGVEHPAVAAALTKRATLLKDQGKYQEAGLLHQQALAISERVHGRDHPEVATSLNYLADVLKDQAKFAEADLLFQKAFAIRENAYGPDHPSVGRCLSHRARLLQAQGKSDEAGPLHDRAISIFEAALGSEHPTVGEALACRALLLQSQRNYEEAGLLHQRAIAISDKAHGSDHPTVAERFNQLAEMFRDQGKYEQAAPLYERAIAIWEAIHVREHPRVADVLANYAELLIAQGKHDEGLPLLERALAIRLKTFGEDHKDTIKSQARLDETRRHQVRRASPPPGSE